ncbi:SAF domain-containing protein [Actinomadura meridiana]|uniref:SAF domain-containing protein n=1 Tax=Actinomadura meridiana TaxID=559626 RepID=A0ABP8BT07_9ACTN
MTRGLPPLRRPLAALFAAAAVGLALLALHPAAPPTIPILTAAHDLPAGTTLTPSDLRRVGLPPASVPSGVLRSNATGRVLAGPMRQGEPLTDARIVGAALLRGYGPDTVATPVRMSDADAVRLLHPGDHIDVLTTTSPTPLDAPQPESHTRLVVSSVPVLAVPSPNENRPQEGALVILATDRTQSAALAGAGAPLTLTITAR